MHVVAAACARAHPQSDPETTYCESSPRNPHSFTVLDGDSTPQSFAHSNSTATRSTMFTRERDSTAGTVTQQTPLSRHVSGGSGAQPHRMLTGPRNMPHDPSA